MRRILVTLALLWLAHTLCGAFPEGEYAQILFKKTMLRYHDGLALYSPTPVEKSKIEGAPDLPVLALYFFRGHLSSEEKAAFAAAISSNTHGAGPEFPYAILELGLGPELPLGPPSVHAFNVGRCTNEKSLSLTGAMLDDPDQVAQWKVELPKLSGELKDGSTITYDIHLEHKASHYQAEFRGNLPLMVVSRSRCENAR